MTPIDPYFGYIEFLVGIVLIIYFGRLALSILKMRADSRVKQMKISQGPKDFQGIQAAVENHEEILNQLFKIRAEQIKQMNEQGITGDKQAIALKPLDQRIKLVEMVKANSFWLQYVAPQADRIISLGLQAVERILKSV